MPLVRQYKEDRVFLTKSLTGMWATDIMDGRVNSLDEYWYAQVFSNGTYVSEIYLMDKKADMGQALNTFVMELGIPE